MPPKKKTASSSTPKPKTVKKAPAAVKSSVPQPTKASATARAPKAAKAAPKAKAMATSTRARKALSVAKPIPLGRIVRQGETRMMAFIRDPQCVFTYWEVTPEAVDEVKRQLMEEYKGSQLVLRVYRTGPGGQVDLIREIRVEPGEMNRYVEIPAEGGVFFLEVVQKAKSGKVAVLTRSNTVAIGPGAAWAMGPSHGTGQGTADVPSGMRDYFADEWDPEGVGAPGRGLSSAETQARSRSRYAASHIG